MPYLQKLDAMIAATIAPTAPATDREAAFPRAAIDALGKAGLLGLISSTDVGGMGLRAGGTPMATAHGVSDHR